MTSMERHVVRYRQEGCFFLSYNQTGRGDRIYFQRIVRRRVISDVAALEATRVVTVGRAGFGPYVRNDTGELRTSSKAGSPTRQCAPEGVFLFFPELGEGAIASGCPGNILSGLTC